MQVSNDNDSSECPLCMEPYEIDDLNFFPCTCGYQVCRFCWHRIRTDENALCPACRKPYTEDPAIFQPLTNEEVQRIKKDRKQRDQQKKHHVSENRKHLSSVRVIQRKLLFVVGLSNKLADAEVLKRNDMFGKYGKIIKIVINPSTNYAGPQGPSASAYVTYSREEEAQQAILGVNNVTMDGRLLRASLGTTKYCSYFLKNSTCQKTDCMYLHEVADQAASFTKEDMQLGKHQAFERYLMERFLASLSTTDRQEQTPKAASPLPEGKSTTARKTPVIQEQPGIPSTESKPTVDVRQGWQPSPNHHTSKPATVENHLTTSSDQRYKEPPLISSRLASLDAIGLDDQHTTQQAPPIAAGVGTEPASDTDASINPVMQLLMEGWPMQHNPDTVAQRHNWAWPNSSLGLSSIHDNSDDDLDFDPFEESKIALTDLINEESASSTTTTNASPSYYQLPCDNNHNLWERPLGAFRPSGYAHTSPQYGEGPQRYSLFGSDLMQGASFHHTTAHARPDPSPHYHPPYPPSVHDHQSHNNAPTTPTEFLMHGAPAFPPRQQVQQQQQLQANFRALLPDVNISFSGQPVVRAPLFGVQQPAAALPDRTQAVRPPPGFEQPPSRSPTEAAMLDVSHVPQLLPAAQGGDPGVLWSKFESAESTRHMSTLLSTSTRNGMAEKDTTPSVPSSSKPGVDAAPAVASGVCKMTQPVSPWNSVVVESVPTTTGVESLKLDATSPPMPTSSSVATTSPSTATMFATSKIPATKKPTAKVKPLNMAAAVPPPPAPLLVQPGNERVLPAIGRNMNELDDFDVNEPIVVETLPPSRPPSSVHRSSVIDTQNDGNRKEQDGTKSKRKKKTKKVTSVEEQTASSSRSTTTRAIEQRTPSPSVSSHNVKTSASNMGVAKSNAAATTLVADSPPSDPPANATLLGDTGQDMFNRLAESTEKLLQTVLSETEVIKTNTEQISKDLRTALERCKEFPPSRSDLEKITSLLQTSGGGGGGAVTNGDDAATKSLDTTLLEKQVETAKREATLLEAKLNDLIRKNVKTDNNGK